MQGSAFSGRQLARGNWKFWWEIGMHLNGCLPGDGNKIDNIMVVR